MNNLQMNSFGVQELNAEEKLSVEGGIAWWPIAIAAIAAYDGLTDFIDGFAEGFNSTYKAQ